MATRLRCAESSCGPARSAIAMDIRLQDAPRQLVIPASRKVMSSSSSSTLNNCNIRVSTSQEKAVNSVIMHSGGGYVGEVRIGHK